MQIRKTLPSLLSALALATFVATPAAAQTATGQTVRIIAPFGAGGGGDTSSCAIPSSD